MHFDGSDFMLRKLLSKLRGRYRRKFLKRMVKCHRSARLFHLDRLQLGKYIYIGPNCNINAQGGVSIADGAILAPEVVVLSSSHDFRHGSLLPYDVFDREMPVEIGAGVWIGYGAMICPGIKIGDGAVVAMGAVVTNDVASGEVVGGNPARVIAKRSNNEEVQKLVAKAAYFHSQYWSGPRPRKVS